MRKKTQPPWTGKDGELDVACRIEELAGWVELGSQKEGLAQARHFLKCRPLHPALFEAALDAVLVQANSTKPWKALVEAAYASLEVKSQQALRTLMFRFYVTRQQWPEARAFLPARFRTAGDLLFAMWTLLELGEPGRARAIQRACERRLRRPQTDFDLAALLEALALFHAFRGELGAAEQCWIESPDASPLACHRTMGLIEIAAVRALLFVGAGFLEVEDQKKEGCDEDGIILPGNTKSLLARRERELRRCQRALERIVPPEDAWRFGLGEVPARTYEAA